MKRLKILISAAETSSDAHAAQLLNALKLKLGSDFSVEAFGLGGPKLRAAGLEALVPAEKLLAMGFSEIIGILPRALAAIRVLKKAASERPADLAILVDYPDFHFQLAKHLKFASIPVIYFIPPKIWAWRKSRLKSLERYFSLVLCILPFEESYYRKSKVPTKYVGSPLLDELPLTLHRAEARAQLSLSPEGLVLVMLPGSRTSELKLHLHLVLDSAKKIAEKLNSLGHLKDRKLQILLPLPVTASQTDVQEKLNSWSRENPHPGIEVRVSVGDAHLCLLAANVGIIKSGTSTLEAAVLGCPHVLIYKPSRSTQWIFERLIRYRGPVGLVNLVAGSAGKDGPDTPKPYLIRELVMREARSELVSKEVLRILLDKNYREAMEAGLREVRSKVRGNLPEVSPSEAAASEIVQWLSENGRLASLK